MGFFSFLGRVLFASLFILSAWQIIWIPQEQFISSMMPCFIEALKELDWWQCRYNEFGSDGGPAAKEMAPKLAGVQRYLASKLGKDGVNVDIRHFVAASIALKGFGGFLFVFGSSLGAYFLLYSLLLTTPLLYDFYNYEYGEPQFVQLLQEFLQRVALFGALLFFIGMKNSIPRKQLKKKTPKTKTG